MARAAEDRLELLPGPVALALLLEDRGQRVAQVDQHLDVQRRVDQPLLGQRPGAPVGRRVPLHQRVAEQRLDHRAEPDAGEAGQPGGELGVEDPRGHEPDLGEARQVLVGGVQHPLGVGDGVLDHREIRQRDGVEQTGARAVAPHLHEIGALAVPVAGGALGVDGHRAGPARRASAYSTSCVDVSMTGVQAVAGGEEGDRLGRVVGGRVVLRLGMGSVLSCRPPSCRVLVRRPPVTRLAIPMLESLAAAAVGGTQQVHPGGGRPAALPRTSSQASRCRSRSVSSAVQEARISTSTVCSGRRGHRTGWTRCG